MAEEYLNYVDGRWVPARSGQTYQSYNPANGEVVGVVPRSSPQDIDDAVAAARKAFDAWRLTPAPRRGEILFRAGALLRERKQELGRMLTREMGKVLPEALGDVQEAIDMAYTMAGEGRRLFGQTTPSELPNKFCMTVRDPVGVVGVITPWNFPTAIPSWKIFPALICGNTAIWKPATDTPVMAALFVKVFEDAGLPPGVLNLVIGPGSDVGNRLVEHPEVSVITFTGSTEVGHRIGGRAGALGKRVSLEMGGKNAIIVMDDADPDLVLDSVIWSAFGTTGQRCTATSRLPVQRGIRQELEERLVERTRRLKLGDGLLEATDVGPVINHPALEKIHGYTQIGVQEGARLLTGGEIVAEGELARGHFYRPTIFTDVRPEMRIAQEEIFGPTLSVMPFDDLDQAIGWNNGVPYGLSSSIFTQDVNRAFRAMRDLATGIVYVNHGTIGAEVHLPFGGTRGTGNGHREGAHFAALETFSEWKTIYVDYSGRLQRAQIDTEALG